MCLIVFTAVTAVRSLLCIFFSHFGHTLVDTSHVQQVYTAVYTSTKFVPERLNRQKQIRSTSIYCVSHTVRCTLCVDPNESDTVPRVVLHVRRMLWLDSMRTLCVGRDRQHGHPRYVQWVRFSLLAENLQQTGEILFVFKHRTKPHLKT